MSTRVRESAVWALAATTITGGMAWLGLYGFAWNDYDNEARASVEALVHGHVGQFFKLAPVYGGSLLERAPFALAPSLWGGGELAVYRMLALPCLLAAVFLSVYIVMWMRRKGLALPACVLALVLITANPLTLLALELGHPDELLGGVLCVAAVLLAARERPILAGLALALAVANKQWALLALGPTLLALPGRRLVFLSVVGAVSVALLAPFALFGPGSVATNVKGVATSTGVVFQPWQIWWFLGHSAHAASSLTNSLTQGDRIPPAWIPTISHPLIIALAVPLTAAAWWRLRYRGLGLGTPAAESDEAARRRELRKEHALLLLTLLLLLRCMLDPWDNIYYPIPFVLALLTWETIAYRRAALLALASTAAVWGGHHWLGLIASPDIQAAFFAAWSIPLATGLAFTLYGGRGRVAEIGQVKDLAMSSPVLLELGVQHR